MSFTPKFVDLVKNSTTVQGTGAVALGAPPTGFTGFAEACAAGDQFYYCIQGTDKPAEREVGRGTMLANGTIAREALGGAALTKFTAGAKTIALVAASEWFAQVGAGAKGGATAFASRAALAAEAASAGAVAVLGEAGREGVFVFTAGNQSARCGADPKQGLAIAPTSDPSGGGGAWLRQAGSGIDVRWFGATGDGTSNDGPAFLAAMATLKAQRVNLGATARLIVPAGHYFLGTTTLDIDCAMRIEGDGSGQVGGVATKLRWAGAVGIRLQRFNTTGNRVTGGPAQPGADGTLLRGLFLDGGFEGGATNPAFHAFDANCRFSAQDCFAYNWGGDGFHVSATAGGGDGIEGNANCFALQRCGAYACRNGFYAFGADANAGTIDSFDGSGNRQWGINDESFLGNTYTGCHAASNGSGPYRTTNANSQSLLNGCYSEGGQPPSSLSPTTLVCGGQHGAGTNSTGFRLYGDSNYRGVLDTPTGQVLLASGGSSTTIALPAPNSAVYLGGNDWTCPFEIATDASGTGYLNVRAGHKFSFSFGFADYGLEVDQSGAQLPAGKVLKVGGTKVVGAQQAAIGDDASGAANQGKVNAILAALRAHGLIAV